MADERRRAVEELISSKALAERLQRDLAAAQQETQTQAGELCELRAELSQQAARMRELTEAVLDLPETPELGDSAVNKICGAALALRKYKAELATEIAKRLGAEQDAKVCCAFYCEALNDQNIGEGLAALPTHGGRGTAQE